MESLKDLIDRRNKIVTDARGILDREKAESRALSAEEQAQVDGLLDDAGKLDIEIDERRKGEARSGRLAALEDRAREQPRRQVDPAQPGAAPPARGSDGACLNVPFGRQSLQLRPGTPEHARAQEGYSRAFESYLRGEPRDYERLGLVQSSDPKGGYLVPMDFLSQVIKFLDDMVFIRQLGTVLPPTSAKSVGVLSFDTDAADADWTPEVPASAITEDDTMRWGGREMTPHQLTKLIKASRKLIRGATLNIESFAASRVAYKMGVTEEKVFLTGSGAQRPLGLFTASANGIPTSRDVICASATQFTADELIDIKFSLKGTYQQKSTWILHRDTVKRARKLKTGDGQYLWSLGMNQLMPDLLCDRPYVMSEFAPNTFTAGLYVALLGDLSFYYIQDGLGLEMQTLEELFALTNQVGWLTRKEVDAMPVLGEAFSRLRLA